MKNDNVQVLHALNKPAPQPLHIFAVYPKEKQRDGQRTFPKLLDGPLLTYRITTDDALAFAMEEAFMKGFR